ncbi:MAG: hypothetical protein KF812_02490 [Fimbriimonadaceae bacterium]|nr:hypothetical protein [Fimbriimonadaceae bacterium]
MLGAPTRIANPENPIEFTRTVNGTTAPGDYDVTSVFLDSNLTPEAGTRSTRVLTVTNSSNPFAVRAVPVESDLLLGESTGAQLILRDPFALTTYWTATGEGMTVTPDDVIELMPGETGFNFTMEMAAQGRFVNCSWSGQNDFFRATYWMLAHPHAPELMGFTWTGTVNEPGGGTANLSLDFDRVESNSYQSWWDSDVVVTVDYAPSTGGMVQFMESRDYPFADGDLRVTVDSVTGNAATVTVIDSGSGLTYTGSLVKQ